MADDRRWPFATDGQPLAGAAYHPDAEPATVAIARVAAEAVKRDPRALPVLYDRIDPDWVDPLLTAFSGGATAGIRAAVEVSLGEVSVLLRDDGRIVVYSGGREPHRLEPSSTVEHDWSHVDSLLRSIGRAVASASDERPVDVSERLLERIDSDAVDRLLHPLIDGSERIDSRLLLSVDGYEVAIEPDGTITVEPSLAVLKRSGAALLVVGSIPEQGLDRASATLLGTPRQARSPVFVLHGRDLETARRRLSMAGIPPSEGVVIGHRASTRAASATATESDPTVDDELEFVLSGEGQALFEASREAIENTAADAPGEPRICVDSLGSMIDSSDLETTRAGIEPICRSVREHRGIGHFLLPVDPDSDQVETLAPSFDAVVALRMGDTGVEQRWRLIGTGHETSWFPLG